jgi:secreted Zn-dependent insulinase-like peptidase
MLNQQATILNKGRADDVSFSTEVRVWELQEWWVVEWLSNCIDILIIWSRREQAESLFIVATPLEKYNSQRMHHTSQPSETHRPRYYLPATNSYIKQCVQTSSQVIIPVSQVRSH